MRGSVGANRVLELPFRTVFVLRKVVLYAVYTNRLCISTRAHLLLSVRMQTTPLADWLAPALALQIFKPKTVKTHFNRRNIQKNWVSNIKKSDVFGQVLIVEGEANGFEGDKFGR